MSSELVLNIILGIVCLAAGVIGWMIKSRLKRDETDHKAIWKKLNIHGAEITEIRLDYSIKHATLITKLDQLLRSVEEIKRKLP